MSITHCPTCKEALHLWPSFNGGTCLFCINPHCPENTEHPLLSPLPGHQDLDASLAAPAQVDQVGGTSFDRARWLLALRILRVLKEFGIASLYGFVFGLAVFAWMLKGVVA